MKLILLTFTMLINSHQNTDRVAEKVQWMDLSLAQEKLETDPRPIIIDLYTDWCYWCKVMDKKTYANKNVARYMTENFYSVKVNAETRQAIRWKNHDFEYNVTNKCNDFALFATQGQLAFPTTVIIPDASMAPIAIPGYVGPKELEPILKYFASGAYKKEKFETYQAAFKTTW